MVTGGAGFIGSHLCDALLAGGDAVVAVDDLSLGRRENVEHLMGVENFEFLHQDLLEYEHLRQTFAAHKFDMVYHLAANSDIQKGGADPTVDHRLTFSTTFNVLMCMREFGVGKLFFASTSAIYGETSDPLTEDYGPLMPVSNYGAGKLASEAFISAFSNGYDIQVWIARFPNVVGERFTHGVIYDFIKKLRANPAELEVLGNGEQFKPYIYVKDLVDGIMFVCRTANGRYNVFNMGVESRTRVKDIARMVIEEMGLRAAIRYTGGDRGWLGDVPGFRYDLSRIHTLGWRASMTSDEAMKLAIKKALGK